MKAVVSVIGKDKIGILAMIANECANASINILDVSQTIVDGMFTMTMSVDFSSMSESSKYKVLRPTFICQAFKYIFFLGNFI